MAMQVDLDALKARQRETWASGDYAVVGTTLQIVGERLCESLDVRGGERVLDVAAGNGNVGLAAARRFCDVVATDYVPSLLERGRERARADGLPVRFEEADAEALPYADGSFDVAASSFGVMFTPDQEAAAAELARVVRPGGRIGLTSWTPDGFVGELFRTIGRHVPPPAGVPSPAAWGTEGRLTELFPGARLATRERTFAFRYPSPAAWLDLWRDVYGPLRIAFGRLEADGRGALADDLLAVVARRNAAEDGTMVVHGAYLEAVVAPAG